MKFLGLSIILTFLPVGSLAKEQDQIVGLETIGGIPSATVVEERTGVFRFFSASDHSPIQRLKIVYEIKETKLKRRFTSDEEGVARLSVFWSRRSPVYFEAPEEDFSEDAFIPDDVFTPLGTLKVRLKKKWIDVRFPHEHQHWSPVVMEFVDWAENKDEMNQAVEATAANAPVASP